MGIVKCRVVVKLTQTIKCLRLYEEMYKPADVFEIGLQFLVSSIFNGNIILRGNVSFLVYMNRLIKKVVKKLLLPSKCLSRRAISSTVRY